MANNVHSNQLTAYEIELGLTAPEFCFDRRFRLTATEEAIARLLIYGRSSRQIGEILGTTEATARHHVERIMLKLDVSSRHDVHRRALHRLELRK